MTKTFIGTELTGITATGAAYTVKADEAAGRIIIRLDGATDAERAAADAAFYRAPSLGADIWTRGLKCKAYRAALRLIDELGSRSAFAPAVDPSAEAAAALAEAKAEAVAAAALAEAQAEAAPVEPVQDAAAPVEKKTRRAAFSTRKAAAAMRRILKEAQQSLCEDICSAHKVGERYMMMSSYRFASVDYLPEDIELCNSATFDETFCGRLNHLELLNFPESVQELALDAEKLAALKPRELYAFADDKPVYQAGYIRDALAIVGADARLYIKATDAPAMAAPLYIRGARGYCMIMPIRMK